MDLEERAQRDLDDAKWRIDWIRAFVKGAHNLILSPEFPVHSELERNTFLEANEKDQRVLDTYTAWIVQKGTIHRTIQWFLDEWDRATGDRRTWGTRQYTPAVHPPELDEVVDPVEDEAPNPPALSDPLPVTPATGPIPEMDHSESS